jgi:hypothetical protein
VAASVERWGPGFRTGRWTSPLWPVKLPLAEGPAAHQLVGRVMAYQGDDG